MTVAVLGAGGGGLSATVELTRAGHDVVLWNRNPAKLERYDSRGEVSYRGIWGNGSVRPAQFSSPLNIDDARNELAAHAGYVVEGGGSHGALSTVVLGVVLHVRGRVNGAVE